MTKSRSDLIMDCLKGLQMSTPDVEGSALVHNSGLIIASTLPAEIEEDRVAAMSAALLALDERISEELARGSLDQVFIKSNHGYIFMISVGEEAVLTTLVRDQAMVGLVLICMRQAAAQLRQYV
jgi:predicted regulator of Ras-like GTPase activity (Roadblock/LC7/MglB family)